MKESFKQKMQENKPHLTFKNTKKNTKNWYTIDALGAIFAIFTILDTFTILLQN